MPYAVSSVMPCLIKKVTLWMLPCTKISVEPLDDDRTMSLPRNKKAEIIQIPKFQYPQKLIFSLKLEGKEKK